MSFSAAVKRELCRLPIGKKCCAAAECYGAFLLGNTFTERTLRIVTTHRAFAGRLTPLMQTAFGVSPESELHDEPGGKQTVSVTMPEDVRRIRAFYGYGERDELALHLNNANLELECCQAAFWRGAFLAGGTVTNPEKKYHLEIATPHRSLARELVALFHESGEDGFEPGHTERSGVQVLYFKASESIENFLTLTGAVNSSMALMEIKIEKDMRNNINRRVNCDNANLDKIVASSGNKRNGILRLQQSGAWNSLPEPLRRAARARLDHPEESLSQLAERLGIGKSCLNHRLRKLEQLTTDNGQLTMDN